MTSPQTPLFRKQSLDSYLGQSASEPLIILKIPHYFMTASIASLVIGIIFWALVGKYSETVRGQGWLEPESGLTHVKTQSLGVVSNRFVGKGDYVNQGDPLLSISSSLNFHESENISSKIINELNNRYSSLEKNKVIAISNFSDGIKILKNRKILIKEEISLLNKEKDGLERQKEIVFLQLERLNKLIEKGYISEFQIDDVRITMERIRNEIIKVERQINNADISLLNITQENDRLHIERNLTIDRIQKEQADIKREITKIDGEESHLIKAPRSGKISNISVNQGDFISSEGNIVLTINPENDSLSAIVLLPSEAIGRVKINDKVKIRFSSLPYRRFGIGEGFVKSISSTPYPKNNLYFSPIQEKTMYKIYIHIHGGNAYLLHKNNLKPGMELQADIILSERKIINWIFFSLLGGK